MYMATSSVSRRKFEWHDYLL